MCAQYIASRDLSPVYSAPEDVSPTQKLTIASSEPSFHFMPPAGGDLTIVSKDGVEFLVHSDALGRSSSVFADMFSIGTKGECAIQLADDAESISLMLGFIYSTDPPRIRDPSLLEKVLQLAQKYDIEAITRTLDETIPNTDLISIDPFRVFQIGLTYGLPNTSMLAAKTTQSQYRYFQDLKAINGFTSRFPGTASLVSLIGIAGARAKILHDVLYDFQSGNPPPDSDVDFDPEMFAELLCTTCFRHLRDWRRFPDPAFRPHWFFDWARLAFNELSAKDIDECDDLFNASVFGRIAPGCDYPSCIREVSSHGPLFNTWAENVKLKLHSELSKLGSLYS
ncbi:hypothetical protein FRC08_002713 [Ceratobasidium sp. 394]|nr:hypothetical protein FRC08_002713 [Ceratobasidium sp. 394]KAG9077158.1 hypothetical protein FS749_010986 [Ceratobasidium sp. UAMH 11750]